MSSRSDVRWVRKHGKRRLIIDFFYFDKDGIRRRFRHVATDQSLTAARAEAARLRKLAAETGSPVHGSKTSKTLAVFVEDRWRPEVGPTYRPGTMERYEVLLRVDVLRVLGDKRLDQIDGRSVSLFLADVGQRTWRGHPIQTRPHYDLVCSILRSAVELGELAELPKDLPKRPKRPKKLPSCPSIEEVHQNLAVAKGWLHDAIALGIFGGLRSGEIRTLRVTDCDLVALSMHVQRSMSAATETTPKGAADRIVPIVPELAAVLRKACAGKLPLAYVVRTPRGTMPTRQLIWSRLNALQKKHGLPHRSVHQLRHGFCTHLLRMGVDIETVRVLAGHSSLVVTERYVHADVDRARVIMRVGQEG